MDSRIDLPFITALTAENLIMYANREGQPFSDEFAEQLRQSGLLINDANRGNVFYPEVKAAIEAFNDLVKGNIRDDFDGIKALFDYMMALDKDQAKQTELVREINGAITFHKAGRRLGIVSKYQFLSIELEAIHDAYLKHKASVEPVVEDNVVQSASPQEIKNKIDSILEKIKQTGFLWEAINHRLTALALHNDPREQYFKKQYEELRASFDTIEDIRKRCMDSIPNDDELIDLNDNDLNEFDKEIQQFSREARKFSEEINAPLSLKDLVKPDNIREGSEKILELFEEAYESAETVAESALGNPAMRNKLKHDPAIIKGMESFIRNNFTDQGVLDLDDDERYQDLEEEAKEYLKQMYAAFNDLIETMKKRMADESLENAQYWGEFEEVTDKNEVKAWCAKIIPFDDKTEADNNAIAGGHTNDAKALPQVRPLSDREVTHLYSPNGQNKCYFYERITQSSESKQPIVEHRILDFESEALSPRKLLGRFIDEKARSFGMELSAENMEAVREAINQLPAGLDAIDVRRFLVKLFNLEKPEKMTDAFMKFMKKNSTMDVLYLNKGEKIFRPGWFTKKLFSITLPHDQLLQQAEFLLNNIVSKGGKSYHFDFVKNEQFAIALRLVSDKMMRNEKGEFKSDDVFKFSFDNSIARPTDKQVGFILSGSRYQIHRLGDKDMRLKEGVPLGISYVDRLTDTMQNKLNKATQVLGGNNLGNEVKVDASEQSVSKSEASVAGTGSAKKEEEEEEEEKEWSAPLFQGKGTKDSEEKGDPEDKHSPKP
ncbi:MAG: hypothetical protein ACD_60C00157G0006 [uncultured bacterium]|nr:MAG: hypothetical protein ACD_60C00157G0006 [uncultured bacterium]